MLCVVMCVHCSKLPSVVYALIRWHLHTALMWINENDFYIKWFDSYYRVGHKSLDKNALKSQVFLFSLLFLYYKQMVVYNVKTCGLPTYTRCSECAAVLIFSSAVTDLGLPDRGRSATNPVCSDLLFKLWIACRDGGTQFGKGSTNKSTTSL
jgi:hypothetical protein